MMRDNFLLMHNLLCELQAKPVKFFIIMQDSLSGILNQSMVIQINEEEILNGLPCFIANVINSKNHITNEKVLHMLHLSNFHTPYNTVMDSE